jgi:drug/metabolite transporter (DMT)-like permease
MGLWNTHAERTGVALAGGAVLLVGGSVAASSLLAGYPVLGGQAIRYAAAGLLLAGLARLRHQQLPRPAGREWCWLAVLAAVGLAGCSVLLIMATRAASPAGVGVVIGAAPLIITIAGPVAAGRRPPGRVLAAAGIVTAGAAISQLGSTTGAGWSLPGLLLSAGALAGVAGTSLLAAPLLPRLGALAVTIYACGLASAQLLVAAVLVRLAGGPPVLRPLTGTELAALLYLAVAVTAVVFVAWFSAVERLGAERTGLFNGLVPIASLIAVAAIGTGTVTGMQLAGALSVLAGVTLGLTQRAGPPAVGANSIIDPGGAAPRIWFHMMPEAKVVKNRLHLDIHVSGSRSDPLATRMQRVAEARRLTDLGATLTGALSADGLDHCAMGMKDPEGNEFDIN